MFVYNESEKEQVLTTHFESKDPLMLKQFPRKEKKKYLALLWIIDLFDFDIQYSERQVNLILKQVYFDFVTIRRYLVDYRLLCREMDGSLYWRPHQEIDEKGNSHGTDYKE